mmetsp:Transcript_15371/g.15958  ORF Transcript_15371/g.15958 Transcript_15371/m.15958 type:complete len:83 (+) Transcript_15371:29-277(+)
MNLRNPPSKANSRFTPQISIRMKIKEILSNSACHLLKIIVKLSIRLMKIKCSARFTMKNSNSLSIILLNNLIWNCLMAQNFS